MQLSPLSSPMTLVASWLISREIPKGTQRAGAPNKRGVGKIRNFQPISRRNSETVQDRTKVTIKWMRFRLVPEWMTLDDLEHVSANFRGILRYFAFLEATTAKRMKIDPYYQRQKCRRMTLVSGNIRRMRTFAGVRLGGDVNDSGVVDDGNFWRFGWLHLRKC